MKPIELKCYFLEDDISDELNDMGVEDSIGLHQFTKALFLNIDSIEPYKESYTIVNSGKNSWIADVPYEELKDYLIEQWNKENYKGI